METRELNDLKCREREQAWGLSDSRVTKEQDEMSRLDEGSALRTPQEGQGVGLRGGPTQPHLLGPSLTAPPSLGGLSQSWH